MQPCRFSVLLQHNSPNRSEAVHQTPPPQAAIAPLNSVGLSENVLISLYVDMPGVMSYQESDDTFILGGVSTLVIPNNGFISSSIRCLIILVQIIRLKRSQE